MVHNIHKIDSEALNDSGGGQRLAIATYDSRQHLATALCDSDQHLQKTASDRDEGQ